MRVLAVLVGLLLFPIFSQGNDSVYVRARMVPVSDQLREGMSQSELAALVSAADKQGHDVWMEASSVVLSGKWMTAKKVREFWYPTNYSAACLYKSKTDTRTFSIETTKLIEGAFTHVIPREPVGKLLSKEIGTVLKMNSRIKANGEITVTGVISQSVLVGFAKSSTPITVVASKGFRKGKVNEISKNTDRTPLFEEVKKEFSVKSGSSNGSAYVGMFLKSTVLGNNFGSAPWDLNGDENDDLNFFGEVGGENLPMVLVLSANAVKPEFKEKPHFRKARSNQVYVTCRFVETNFSLNLKKPILSHLEFQKLIRRLSQAKGVDVVAAPSIMTRPSQEAKIEMVREFIFPDSYKRPEFQTPSESNGFQPVSPSTPSVFKTRDLGIRVEITSRLIGEGMIELRTDILRSSFEGFVNYGNPIFGKMKNPSGKPVSLITENRILGPVFPARASSTTVIIPDGWTVALSGMAETTRDGIVINKKSIFHKKEESEFKTARYVTVFLTAQMMDASGLPIQR